MAAAEGFFSSLFYQASAALLPYGAVGLFVLAFAEASFFPVPPDVLLASLAIADPAGWLGYALVASAGSVAGAYAGYFLGWKVGEPLLERVVDKKTIQKGHRFFEQWGAAAVLLAAFTPIPFKVFTILSGVLYLDLARFGAAALAGRTLRFVLVAWVAAAAGGEVLALLDRYLGWLGAAGLAGLALAAWRWWRGNRRAQKREAEQSLARPI